MGPLGELDGLSREFTTMNINEALRRKFGIDLTVAFNVHGEEGARSALRAQLHEAAEEALDLGGPAGGTEIRLAVLADYMAHLVLALNGQGNEPCSTERDYGYWTVDGVPACQSPHTADPLFDPPLTCSPRSPKSTRKEAERFSRLKDGHDVSLRRGRCPRGGSK